MQKKNGEVERTLRFLLRGGKRACAAWFFVAPQKTLTLKQKATAMADPSSGSSTLVSERLKPYTPAGAGRGRGDEVRERD
jgi:hypothetical protein